MEIWQALSDSPGLFGLAIGALGLIVGSFLNVVIHRLPVMLDRQWRNDCSSLISPVLQASEPSAPFNLMVPRSRCPYCQGMITALDNIPVVSYVMLGGRCRHCKARISARYPLVEVVSAGTAAFAAMHFGFGLMALFAVIFTWALIALTLIDFDTQLLPDVITLPMMWLGILVNYHGLFVSLQVSVIGAVVGYLSLWTVYWLFKLVTGKEGMGYGDFKLLAMIGAWLGWPALPAVILLASVVGSIVGLGLIVLRGHDRAQPIPFGPYLASAGWLAMLGGQDWIQHFFAPGGL